MDDNRPSTLAIGMIGQCALAGWSRAGRGVAYPRMVRGELRERRPDLKATFTLRSYWALDELEASVQDLLQRRPDWIHIEVIGSFATLCFTSGQLRRKLPRRLFDLAYARFRGFGAAANRRAEHGHVRPPWWSRIAFAAANAGANLVGRAPMNDPEDYRQPLDAISRAAAGQGTRLILQLPNVPSPNGRVPRVSDASERVKAIREIIIETADRHGLTCVTSPSSPPGPAEQAVLASRIARIIAAETPAQLHAESRAA